MANGYKKERRQRRIQIRIHGRDKGEGVKIGRRDR
jgi:hypothetical protein